VYNCGVVVVVAVLAECFSINPETEQVVLLLIIRLMCNLCNLLAAVVWSEYG